MKIELTADVVRVMEPQAFASGSQKVAVHLTWMEQGKDDKTFEQVLPLGLVGSVEKAISSYLPLALKRLGGLLEDREARDRFEGVLHDLFHRFLRDLNFYQRVVARLIVTEETVDRVLDTIEQEGAERLSNMLREQEMQDAMARGVNDAIVDFLRRPVTSVLGSADDHVPEVGARQQRELRLP